MHDSMARRAGRTTSGCKHRQGLCPDVHTADMAQAHRCQLPSSLPSAAGVLQYGTPHR